MKTLLPSSSESMASPVTPTSVSKLFHFIRHHPRSYVPVPSDSYRQRLLSMSCSSSSPTTISGNQSPPVVIKRKRTRYRKQYPGESVGITEEMRFVALRLRNVNGKKCESNDETESEKEEDEQSDGEGSGYSQNKDEETWKPSKEGLLKYLVDSKLVFDTIERIIEESEDVSYAYFRRTGLERSRNIENDLMWFKEQGYAIPEPSNPGVSYAKYLKERADQNAPLFLSHFYNIYFSHVAGGQVIVRQVSEKLLEGKELEFTRWEDNTEELLRGVREKLNTLGEHWSRDEKNKCLKETAKAFKYMGQIVRLIVL
ncbi:PREDICTED: probable inactive heme oxygenase 2, chloroplastic [Tarenaya hassleriana]|uniref:probable inactive heme oxygenase 2, chloroplastic n=1 Tax=Tarenaya hassleriana TaxID=28532 RepID=UPI00053C25E8|nr:PREDICTED: probable inactive heme oxygenase 2, chloroplastic [Tarenaya hassleriana]